VESPGEFQWLILRPPLVYGPGDRATRLLFRQALAPLTPVPWTDRPLSLIHVRDLVQAIVLAGSSSSSQRILPLEGPDRLTIHELPRAIAAACSLRAKLVPLPLFGLRGIALLADATARLRGRPGLFSRDKVREIAAAGWVADPRPAREVLGFDAEIPTRQGFRDTAREEGFPFLPT
jgi:nucleoside-diphosphate-sugar epimerase